MKITKDAGYCVFIFALLVVFGLYVRSTKEVVYMNDAEFRFVGMAQLPNQDVYTPVYQRIK